MSDKLISGRDDITGKDIIPTRDFWPESKWQPPARQGKGMFQKPREARIPPMPNGSKPELVQLPDSWPGITLTEVGAVFDYDKVTRETWIAFGRWAGAMAMRCKLWVSDWIRFGSREDWGYSYSDMATLTGLEIETLRSYASIGWSVPVENRILGPKPSFYAAVAPLPYQLQRTVLERAKAEGLSRNDLRDIAAPYKEAAKLAGLTKGKGGRPAPTSSLADDIEAAVNAVVVPAQPSLEFEGSIAGARAFLAELPEAARVRIVIMALD